MVILSQLWQRATDMTSLAQFQAFVGIDYHDSVVQICVLDAAGDILGNEGVPNEVAAILEYVGRGSREFYARALTRRGLVVTHGATSAQREGGRRNRRQEKLEIGAELTMPSALFALVRSPRLVNR